MATTAPTAVPAPEIRFEPALMRRKLTGTLFYGACLFAIGILLLSLIMLLYDVLARGLPWLDPQFITGVPSRRPANAGILPALVGSLEIGIIVGLIAFPIGVAAAIYLAEYASDSWVNRLLQTNISNLAGVPSIIYGILGLAVFVRIFSLGPTILSAGLTLTLLILPVVIIASIEAIKAVPGAQREGAYALGATRWQMVRGSVLPAAAPGIMTGIILAMARAVGEAAPLILIGAFALRDLRAESDLGWLHRPADPDLRLGTPAAGRLRRDRLRGDHRHPDPHARPQRPRAHRAHTPVEAYPVVEENPVQARVSETPVRESSTDGTERTIHIAAAPRDASTASDAEPEYIVELQDVSCYYGSFRAVRNVDIKVAKNAITALIGPSGCGKSTLLRTINRMNDLIPSYRSEGRILLDQQDLFGKDVDPVAVRRRVGMVFQKPNPFPKTVWENVAFGPKINGYKGDLNELVERSLRRAALWDDVKDKLKQSGMALSGGQQQRLCIARTIAVNPEVILMDEPCSALDPRSTLQIEELMAELKREYTIVIVTHNMQQAARASDTTVFMTMGDDRAGYVVERAPTVEIFTNPKNQLTEDYVSGRFG